MKELALKNWASWFVLIATLVNIAACLWLMWWTAKRRGGETQATPGETTGHVWDGDLKEYNNPLPRWWLWLFILTIVFGLGYLTLYPGLGNFAGTKNYTQSAEHAAEASEAQAKLEAHLAGLTDKSVVELAHSDKALSTARNLFGIYCVACHGSDARGAKGFPNLTDNDWLWGGDAANIEQTIAQGRVGTMPSWGAVLGDQGVEEVAAYVESLSGRKVSDAARDAGAQRFATFCVACHGADGKGWDPLESTCRHASLSIL